MAVRIEPGLHDCYELSPAASPARPDLLLGHAPAAARGRPAVRALYALVREIDDVVDAPGRVPASAPPLRAALGGAAAPRTRGAGRASVVVALVDAGRRHDLPLDELDLYFDSMRFDCAPVRVQTWDELERYMRGSAGSVGRILGALLGAPGSEHEPFERLALAFQLTNFVRDVRGLGARPRVHARRGSRALRRLHHPDREP